MAALALLIALLALGLAVLALQRTGGIQDLAGRSINPAISQKRSVA